MKSKVLVKTPTGDLVHEGMTDDAGMYSFALASISNSLDTDLVIQLDAGTGHSNHWTLSRDEIVQAPTAVDIEEKMTQKRDLEQEPFMARILGGIGIIFLLALTAGFLVKRAKALKND